MLWRRGMTRRDRQAWAAARNLRDLGELTARWLEGELASLPGYYGPVDVDEDLAKGLTAALVACNRAGYVTTSSQAGWDGPDIYGKPWRAYVTGFATTAVCTRLRRRLARAGLATCQWPVKARWRRALQGPFDELPRQLPESEIRCMYGGCHRKAVEVLCDAQQLVCYDPRPGRNKLWRVLQQTFDGSRR